MRIRMIAFGLIVAALLPAMTSRAQETYKFADRDTCSLYLDIYRPAPDAVRTIDGKEKPVVLFVFGGGFVMGRRNEPTTVTWFQKLAEEGYPVVSIDYRLGMKGYKVGKGLSNMAKASNRFLLSQQIGVEDVFSAISFLADQREQLGLDPDNIVLAGSSAGAIISLAAAYAVANGEATGLPEGFRFKGVMSFAGAIISTTGAPKFKEAPCPVLFLHGTEDKVVAYRHYGAFGRGLWGSDYIAEQFGKSGWPCCIWRFKGKDHVVASYMRHIWPIEKEFLEKAVTQGVALNVDALIDDPSLPVWRNFTLDDIY